MPDEKLLKAQVTIVVTENGYEIGAVLDHNLPDKFPISIALAQGVEAAHIGMLHVIILDALKDLWQSFVGTYQSESTSAFLKSFVLTIDVGLPDWITETTFQFTVSVE